MAFRLPPGLMVRQGYGEQPDDAAVAAIEAAQAPGTRMLVALVFPFRWPGFGWSADQADWAARNIAGLEPWPEATKDGLRRAVVADDTEPVWWVCYLASPAWWTAIIAALGVFILAAIAVRVVWTVLPEEARGGLEAFINLIPMLVMAVVIMAIMPVFREMAPPLVEKGKRKLPGG